MSELPAFVENLEQLEDLMSRPSGELVESMKELDGDVMVIGAGGKVGPTLVRMLLRAVEQAGVRKKITAVDVVELPQLAALGAVTIRCDLMDMDAVNRLPDCENIVFMVGRKFGSTGGEHLTWAINVVVPYHVARRFAGSRQVVFSTGCVYPMLPLDHPGCTEATPADPVGEYAQSCLGRERMFDYFSLTGGSRVVHIRLNYAVELRYGVLFDVANYIWKGKPVDVTAGYANVIWQGDACDQILRSFALASGPPAILNVTGPEKLSIRETAERFAKLLGRPAILSGAENGRAYLSDATRAVSLYGRPKVSPDTVIRWIGHWLASGHEGIGKPTHFETQNGRY